jgi:hypothetical protein
VGMGTGPVGSSNRANGGSGVAGTNFAPCHACAMSCVVVGCGSRAAPFGFGQTLAEDLVEF